METATTLPVDFHSTRRAYATALARVGVNDQTTMVLTGHSDSKVHRRYIESLTRQVPASAVPQLSITEHHSCTVAVASRSAESKSKVFFRAGHGVRTRDPKLGKLVLYQLS